MRKCALPCAALLALSLVDCTHIKQKDAQRAIQVAGESSDMKRIVGVTLKDGREIRFDKNSLPLVRGDTLQAEAGSQPLAIAVSDIQWASVKSLNKTKTGLAVFGIGFVLATIFIGIGFSGI